MSAKPIEMILLRQLARRMPMPVVLVDAGGRLIYINPATEQLLGYASDDFPDAPLTELQEVGDPRDVDNNPLPAERMPIAVALNERRPQQATMIVHDVAGRPRRIVTTSIPLDGQGGTLIGAMSIFWEE